jgi:undecaprenyl-diphosphatase
LGIVQGLTEFLPVSSSGHLVLFQRLFGLTGDMLYFDIAVHLATLCAVIIVFRRDVWRLIRHPLSKTALLLVLSAIPAVIIALLFKGLILDAFGGGYLAYGFLATAALLTVTDVCARAKASPARDIGIPSALLMGAAQGLAVLPGVSRSGATVCTGMLSGCDRETSARFSFLMSIPIIIGSGLMSVIDLVKSPVGLAPAPLAAAFLCAFATGIAAIRFMLRIIKKRRFYGFAIYLVLLAAATFFIL